MAFGATDFWGFADTYVVCVDGSASPSTSAAQSMDSRGDVKCETLYDSVTAYSSTYDLLPKTDTAGAPLAVALPDLGTIKSDTVGKRVLTSIAVTTSNTGYPRIVLAGQSKSDSTAVATYAPDKLEDYIVRAWGAVAIGQTPDTGVSCTGSNATFAASPVRVLNALGVEKATEIHGARIDATNEYSKCTGNPSATTDTADGWKRNSGPNVSTTNTSYATASYGVYLNAQADT